MSKKGLHRDASPVWMRRRMDSLVSTTQKPAPQQLLVAGLLCAFAVEVIAMQQSIGWGFWVIGAIVLAFCKGEFRNHVALLYLSLGLLGFTPIDTDIHWSAIGHFSIMLTLVILTPWALARFVLKTNLVEFRFGWRQRWTRPRIVWAFVALALSYLVFPWYLKDTSAPAALGVPAYENWMVGLDIGSLGRLFLGTNGLGIWDELFFINVSFAILRRHFPFWQANIFQAVLFTSFLFDLGFTGWGPFLIYVFALLQGFIYEKTRSLFYVIAIHLTVDFVLYLALVDSHFPGTLHLFLW